MQSKCCIWLKMSGGKVTSEVSNVMNFHLYILLVPKVSFRVKHIMSKLEKKSVTILNNKIREIFTNLI